MFSLLISLITQPWTLIALVVIALAAAGYAYWKGVPGLVKIAADGRTWMVVLAALFIIGSANLNNKVEDLQEEVKIEQVENDSFADASDVLVDRNETIRERAGERQRITVAQIEAAPGEEVDAVMDAIAAEDQRRLDADAGT